MQGTAQIKALLDHIHRDTVVGDLIRAELETASLEIGSGSHLFQMDYEQWHFLLTDCWIKSLWKFCSDNTISL